MEKGLMYGLLGIGIAIVIAVGFVVLALVGPSIKEKRAEKAQAEEENIVVSELQTKVEVMEGLLQDERQKNSQQQNQIDSMRRSVEALQDAIADMKATPPEPEKKEPEKELNIYDLSTLTKENCPDALDQIKEEESNAKNESDTIENEIDEKKSLKTNLTQQRDNLNTSASNYTSEKNRLDNEIEDVEDEIDDLANDLNDANDKRDDLRKRRRDIETKCRELGAKV